VKVLKSVNLGSNGYGSIIVNFIITACPGSFKTVLENFSSDEDISIF